MDELKHDMVILRRHGFNVVKLQEHWAFDEPARTRLDSARHEELIEHASVARPRRLLPTDARAGAELDLGRASWKSHVGAKRSRIAFSGTVVAPADGSRVRYSTNLQETIDRAPLRVGPRRGMFLSFTSPRP